MRQTANQAVYEAALAYVAAGLSVIPIKVVTADGSKKPAVPWKAYQDRLATEDELCRWFARAPQTRGVAIVGGSVSGNLEILDFDSGAVYEDFLAIVADTGVSGVVDAMPAVLTPSGGCHLYYRLETQPPGSSKIAQTAARNTLIETRGQGGYAVAPPSPAACHPDKRPYELLQGDLTRIPVLRAGERSALLALAQSLTEYLEPAQKPRQPRSAPRTGGGMRPGEDYNVRGDWEALLERYGWRRLAWRGERAFWQRPGKEIGPSATWNYANSQVFYVFSTNAAPFEAGRSYTPFGIYAMLEHGGDFIAAARQLSKDGYGDQGKGPDPGGSDSPAPLPSDADAPPARAAKPPAAVDASASLPQEVIDLANAETLEGEGRGEPSDLMLALEWAHAVRGKWLWVVGEQWWKFEGQVWRRSSAQESEADLQHFLEAKKRAKEKIKLTSHKVGGVLKLARNHLGPMPATVFDQHPSLLALKNGVFNVESGHISPHDPKLYLTHCANFNFEFGAQCPTWERFLSEVLINEDGSPCQGWIAMVQQWFGYCLLPDTSQEMSMFWVGRGGNGKGVMTRILSDLVGREWCMALPIEQLDDEYIRAQLHGKLLGFVNEPKRRALEKNGEWFKAVTGRDLVQARHPRGDGFQYAPSCRIVVTCNRLPEIDDTSEGPWRRICPIAFRRNFSEDERDAHLDTKLRAELPGIFNWAIEGLRAYRAAGRLVRPPESMMMLNEYRRDEDSFVRFFEERCVAGSPEDKIESRQLYLAYKRWAETGGERHILGVAQFGHRMNEQGYKSAPIPGAGRCYRGVKFAQQKQLEDAEPTLALEDEDAA